MAIKSVVPTIDVLPPMSQKVRDLLYGVLAWAAGLLGIATAVIALVPDWHVERPLLIVNTVVMGLWSLGGFKAKANVGPAANVDGRHEAGESALYTALLVLVVIAIVVVILRAL